LINGQTVEIITAPGAAPSPAWLNFVVTAKARSHIRSFLKDLERDEACDLGRRLLNRELERFGTALEHLAAAGIEAALTDLHLKSTDALLEDIGLGKRPAPIVARHLIPASAGEVAPAARTALPLAIKGTEGMVVSFPKCCYPIPGDAILGYVSAGRGIVIHRRTCKNVAEFKNHPEKWVDVEWGCDIDAEFPVAIRLEARNQRGALATIAAAVAKEDANIEFVGMSERDEGSAGLSLVVAVRDRRHLARVIRSVRTTQPVSRVVRLKG
ncbi:MAG: RelA/SpoT AH/RIS domain-containing protein, partial [Gammaproteobacteria bacterium]